MSRWLSILIGMLTVFAVVFGLLALVLWVWMWAWGNTGEMTRDYYLHKESQTTVPARPAADSLAAPAR